MRQVWKVASREIRQVGKSKAYILTSAAVLLAVVALVVIPNLSDGGPTEHDVGLVGEGNEEIIEASEQLANLEGDDDSSVDLVPVEYDSRESGLDALEAGEVEALLVDGDEVVVESIGFRGNAVHDLLQRGAAAVELERLLAEDGETTSQVIELMTSDPLTTTTVSEDGGPSESDGILAFAGLMLLYIAILVYGTWILTGVTEEKTNRVVEVLLSALRPWQLLGGKILGVGILGIAQFVATIIVALAAISLTGALELPDFSVLSVANLVLWFVLGFLLFAVLFGAAGSLVSRTEDAQTIAFPMSLIAVAGFFVSLTALSDPEGATAVIATFIPVTAVFVVPVRVALDAIPGWQYAAAVVLTVVTILIMVRVAGRIYAGGVLRFGSKVGWREAWRGAVE